MKGSCKLLAAITVVVSVGLASQARATSQLDFHVLAPTTGTISYGGGSTALLGTAISVDNVIGLNTPVNNNLTRNCIGCVLEFDTGGFTGSTSTQWNFGPGGSVSIVGGVDLNNNTVLDAGDIQAGTTLLSGSFIGTASVLFLGADMQVAGGAFLDVKDADLAAFYGLPGGSSTTYSGLFNLSFNAIAVPGDPFTSDEVLSGNVVNETDVPSSLVLLGSGLIGLTYLTVARGRRN